MKKRWLTAIIMAALLLVQAVVICGGALADEAGEQCTHEWGDWESKGTYHVRTCKLCEATEKSNSFCWKNESEWAYNATHHWHPCSFNECTMKFDEAEHNFVNGVCACGYKQPHAHQWDSDWSSDESGHWHACTVEGCGWTYDEAEHTWGEWIAEGTFHERECTVCHRVQHENHDLTDGKCDICGFTMHGAQDEWKYDEHTHWHECKFAGCTDKLGENEHDLVNGVCRVCGYGKIDYPVYDDVQPIVSAPLPPQTGDASYLAIGIGMIAAALCIALRKRQSN